VLPAQSQSCFPPEFFSKTASLVHRAHCYCPSSSSSLSPVPSVSPVSVDRIVCNHWRLVLRASSHWLRPVRPRVATFCRPLSRAQRDTHLRITLVEVRAAPCPHICPQPVEHAQPALRILSRCRLEQTWKALCLSGHAPPSVSAQSFPDPPISRLSTIATSLFAINTRHHVRPLHRLFAFCVWRGSIAFCLSPSSSALDCHSSSLRLL
jgi:hypothetical protein